MVNRLPLTHQSTAGATFQTMSRLGGAVGFGLTTAVFNAISASLADQGGVPSSGYYAGDHYAPYAGAFWVACGANVIGLMVCPWLRIGTQGAEEKSETDTELIGGTANKASDKEEVITNDATTAVKNDGSAMPMRSASEPGTRRRPSRPGSQRRPSRPKAKPHERQFSYSSIH